MAKPDKILLVEDDPNDVELTLTALTQNHLTNEIAVVRDGVEALDYNDPDVLLSVKDNANQQKGDKGPEAWSPPN